MKVQEKRLIRTLQQLVRIPSHESCDEISKFVATEIRKLGIKPEVDKDGNIIARIGAGPALLLNAHMDTVGVENYPNAFSGRVVDNKIYGRGSTDDKSGVAAKLELMKILKQNPPNKQIIFAFTVGEEGGNKLTDGAYKVIKRVKASHALTLESSMLEDGNLGIVTGCKGRFVYNIDVIGKASHSGRPWMGKNAITLASKLVEKLNNFKTISMKIPENGEASSYLNVTQIEAKEGNNIIPGKCSLTVDYRCLPGEKEKEIKKKIQKVCESALGKSFKISLISIRGGYLEKRPQLTEIAKQAASESGFKPFIKISDGWGDVQAFNEAGMISINVGPGTSGQAHKNPEYCWIPGLVKGTQAILNILRRWDAL
jgi:acetylornithine deacetylase/succinyl-diaminopimelate desuccinylase-like protein